MISGACSDRPPLSKGTCFGGFDGGRICQGDKSLLMPFRYRTDGRTFGWLVPATTASAERERRRFLIDLLEQIFITLQRGQSNSATTDDRRSAVCRGRGPKTVPGHPSGFAGSACPLRRDDDGGGKNFALFRSLSAPACFPLPAPFIDSSGPAPPPQRN